jgi:hypothetical protein
MAHRPAQTRALEFDQLAAARRLFVLEYTRGFWCDGVMHFEEDFVPRPGSSPDTWPKSGDLMVIGDRNRLESIACLHVPALRGVSSGERPVVSVVMGPLLSNAVMPLAVLRPCRSDLTMHESGHLEPQENGFEMPGRLVLLAGKRDLAMRKVLRQRVGAEFLSHL